MSDKFIVQWGELRAEAPTFLSPNQPTLSGNASTILFNAFQIELQTPTQPLQAMALTSFQIPMTLPINALLLGTPADIRGDITKSEGTRVILFINIGTTVITHEFPFGKAETGTSFVKSLVNIQTQFTPFQQENKQYSEHPFTGNLVCQVVLIAERMSVDETLWVSINSLEMGAVFVGELPAEEVPNNAC